MENIRGCLLYTSMDAGWDEELLRVEIESLQGMDFDPLLTGFDEKELAALFDDGIEAKEDDFDVDAELEKPCFSRLGDVWTLGRHRLVCGDSTKPETYTMLMGETKANLCLLYTSAFAAAGISGVCAGRYGADWRDTG